MRVSRPVLAAVAAWVLVVAVGSTLVWAVISRAGDGVVSTDGPAPSSSGSEVGRSATVAGRPTISAGPTTGPTTAPTTAPTTGPTTPSSSPPGEPVRRTWQGVGGTVTVLCTGGAAGLDSALPEGGFSVEVHDRGPERVEVRFEEQDGERRSRVRATCVAGTPRFDVDVDTD